MFSDDHLYSIALRKCSLVGDINFQKLVEVAGSAKEVWESSKQILTSTDGIGQKTIAEIGNDEILKFAEKELDFCRKNNVKILLKHAGFYPKLLAECEDAPSILYQKGEFDENLKNFSMVGTRNMTIYGRAFIAEFFQNLPKNCASVSGLALGVDSEMHEQSLKNEIPTIAVLAHGFHTLYPSKNRILSQKILEKGGCLLTEFNSSQKPDRENFIQRNRVIAGLSPATIVVETAFGGGSISTVSFANTYNRDIYALPGRISDKYSQGCNQLIWQNKARAISTIKDLIDELGFGKIKPKTAELFGMEEKAKILPENHRNIYAEIAKNSAISLDDLANSLQLPSHSLLPILLQLEIQGYIKANSGRQYSAL